MVVLKILWILVGILLAGFGYLIYIKKKYSLINNFEDDKKLNIYDDIYASRVGLIELIGGFVCVVLGIVSFFLNTIFSIVMFIVSIFGIIMFLIVNMVKSSKRKKELRP